MNRPELYEKSVNLLLDAYNNKELMAGDCSTCAVGNMCKEASTRTGIENHLWSYLFSTGTHSMFGTPYKIVRRVYASYGEFIRIRKSYGYIFNDISVEFVKERYESGKKLVEETGYIAQELSDVEWAFEKTLWDTGKYHYYRKTGDTEGQLIGLTAVLKELARIHDIDNPELIESNQSRLNSIYESKTSEKKCEVPIEA